MIDITQEEFEAKIQDIIDGKLSKTKLVKELETDSRTLNNKIQELSVYNIDLYLKLIEKYPYKQKVRDDIDYEALAIEIVKKSMTTKEASKKYGLGERTIRRKIDSMEEENPELFAIYKEVKENIRYKRDNSLDLQNKIERLVPRTVKIAEMNETRKRELEDLESIFNNRCEHETKTEAAKSMGITLNRMIKLLNELYVIRIEESHRMTDATFKDSLKVNSSNTTIKTDTSEDNNLEKTSNGVNEKEGEEK